jgi:hypothetical protein
MWYNTGTEGMGTDQKVVVCYAPEKKLVNPSPTKLSRGWERSDNCDRYAPEKKLVNPLTISIRCDTISKQ